MTRSYHIVSVLVVSVLVGVFTVPTLAVNMETVAVGNPGNAADTRYTSSGFGSVAYTYQIGKYEATAGQYTEFLNKVAATDSYGLYNTNMWSDSLGCMIQRSGTSGSYTYSVASDYANRPVNYVSWGDAARFANWLHNGQPTGTQNASTTEDGAYTLNGATSNTTLKAASRNGNWKWAVPTEDEWFKAAYYDPNKPGGYWDYPTSSNTLNTDMANYDYSVGYTTEVGTYRSYPSPYGTFDQGGNVWEWNDASPDGPYRGLRGGSFDHDDGVYNYLYASSWNYFGNPADESRYVGFRVSSVPEPCTMTLLAFGGAALIRRKCR